MDEVRDTAAAVATPFGGGGVADGTGERRGFIAQLGEAGGEGFDAALGGEVLEGEVCGGVVACCPSSWWWWVCC